MIRSLLLLADLVVGGHAEDSPLSPNFFIFMQFSGKNIGQIKDWRLLCNDNKGGVSLNNSTKVQECLFTEDTRIQQQFVTLAVSKNTELQVLCALTYIMKLQIYKL